MPYFLLSFLLLIFVTSTVFLVKELLKKFKFWKSFQKNHTNQLSWIYQGDKTPGMYTLVLRWDRSFRALIGFDFSIGSIGQLGYDVFGCMESDSDGYISVSLYLGHGPVEFIFLIDGVVAQGLQITCNEAESQEIPTYTYLPHWWQRLSFFG